MEELENEISTQAEENTVSLASAQALADALAKIEVYTPTTWVDNSSPDIDAEHLNKPEQAIKRVTDALNSAVDVIKDLQSQVTKNAGDISTVNNNLSQKVDATTLSSYMLKSDIDIAYGELSDGEVGTVHGYYFKSGHTVIFSGYINSLTESNSKWYNLAKLPFEPYRNTGCRPLIGGTGTAAIVRDGNITGTYVTAWLGEEDVGKYIWFSGTYFTTQ